MLYLLKDKAPKKVHKSHHTMFYVVDLMNNNKEVVERKIFQTKQTYKKILRHAKLKRYNILYRGIYLFTREEVKQITVEKQIIKLPQDRRVLDNIFIDIDKNDPETSKKLRGFVMYMKKLGIDLSVFKTKRGYHVYLTFENPFITINEKRIRFTKNKKVQEIIEAIKYILRKKIKLDFDIISANYSVFLERYYNPIKESKSSFIFQGKYIKLENARDYINRFYLLSQPIRRTTKQYSNNSPRIISINQLQFKATEKSNITDLLRDNYYPGFAMARMGVPVETAHAIFQEKLNKKIPIKTFVSFYNFCIQHKDDSRSRVNSSRYIPNKNKDRIYKRFTEHVKTLYEFFTKNGTNYNIRQIARLTGIPRSSVDWILKRHSKEDILKNHKLVISAVIRKNKNKLYEWHQKRKQRIKTKQNEQSQPHQQTQQTSQTSKETCKTQSDSTKTDNKAKKSFKISMGGTHSSLSDFVWSMKLISSAIYKIKSHLIHLHLSNKDKKDTNSDNSKVKRHNKKLLQAYKHLDKFIHVLRLSYDKEYVEFILSCMVVHNRYYNKIMSNIRSKSSNVLNKMTMKLFYRVLSRISKRDYNPVYVVPFSNVVRFGRNTLVNKLVDERYRKHKINSGVLV